MGSKGSNTSTSTNATTSAPDPKAQQAYYELLSRAAGVANTPYTSYNGELVAPLNSQQQTGISGINANAGFAAPYIQDAASLARSASTPLTADQIAAYQSPYTQQVVDATQRQFASQNAQQQQALTSNAIAQGALGGNRTGVAAANLAQAQQIAQAPVIAGLYNQGYQSAANLALSQQQAQAQGAYSLGNLGVAGQQSALSGAGAQLGAGTLQQQTQQAQDAAAYNQFLLQQAYPFQTTQWLAGLQTGVGSQLGGTSTGTATQTGPSPNSTGQWLGAGLSAASLIFSDRRLKEDIHKIGETNDGQPIYRFRYKGDPQWQIGLIAQEVEKDHPEAVHGVGGYKAVDLKAATDGAAHRALGGPVGYDQGGGIGGSPFGGAQGYVPTIGIAAGRGAPQATAGVGGGGGAAKADGFSDPTSIMKNAASLGKSAWNAFQDWNNQPLDLSAPGIAAPNADFGGGVGNWGGTGGLLGGFYANGGGVAGFADGGAPSFDERFAGDAPAIFAPTDGPVADPRPTTPQSPAYWLERAGLPAQVAGFEPASPAADPAVVAPVNPAAAPRAPQPGVAPAVEPDVSAPNLTPGAAAPAMREPGVIGARPVSADAGDLLTDLPRYKYAMGAIESGHRYDAIGPQTSDGDRAYGYYQVMGKNIGPWTKQILGRSMTPQEFLNDSKAQDAVFNSRFGQYLQQTGSPDDAASMWFTGRPLAQGARAADVTGTTGADYVARFRTALQRAPGAEAGVAVATGPAGRLPDNAQTAQYVPTKADEEKFGLLGLLSPEAGNALLTAGVGMMASQSPFLGTQIGEGALRGVKSYGDAVQAKKKMALDTRKVDLDARRLDDAAKRAERELSLRSQSLLETQRHNQSVEEQGRWKLIGTNDDGFPVYKDMRTGEEKIGDTRLQQKAPSGYVRNPDGTMSAIKGGPADPEVQRGIADAKRGAPMNDATADFLAERVIAGDGKALVGLGRGAQGAENIARVQNLVAAKAAARNLDASDLLAKTAEQSGLTAQQRTFGQQTARMAINATEAQGAIQLGRKASEAVPRTRWVPLNRVIQKGQVIASDPALAQFGAANLAIVNTYARAISPTGVPTVHDKEHAEQLLSTATSQEAYNAVLDQLDAEIQIAHDSAPKAKRELEALRQSGKVKQGAGAGAAFPMAPQNPADRREGEIYRGPNGNVAKWINGGWQRVQ